MSTVPSSPPQRVATRHETGEQEPTVVRRDDGAVYVLLAHVQAGQSNRGGRMEDASDPPVRHRSDRSRWIRVVAELVRTPDRRTVRRCAHRDRGVRRPGMRDRRVGPDRRVGLVRRRRDEHPCSQCGDQHPSGSSDRPRVQQRIHLLSVRELRKVVLTEGYSEPMLRWIVTIPGADAQGYPPSRRQVAAECNGRAVETPKSFVGTTIRSSFG